MRILVVGTGGVGSAFARIATRRGFFESCALADYDPARAHDVAASLDDGRFSAHAVDASSAESVAGLIRETRADAVLNSVDPLFNVPVFDACFEAGVTYLDMYRQIAFSETASKRFSGASFCSRWMIPVSVAMRKRCFGERFA